MQQSTLSPNFGLKFWGAVTVEVALLDALLDFYYFFTNPFASVGLHTACFAFLIVPQVLPAILCFCSMIYVTFDPKAFGGAFKGSVFGGVFTVPFGWDKNPEWATSFPKVLVAGVWNCTVRPIAATLLSILFAILWNMKLLGAFLYVMPGSQLGSEEFGLQVLGFMVYNE